MVSPLGTGILTLPLPIVFHPVWFITVESCVGLINQTVPAWDLGTAACPTLDNQDWMVQFQSAAPDREPGRKDGLLHCYFSFGM